MADGMILRVAQAICKSRTCEGINCCQWPCNMGRVECPVRKGGYDNAARDAIWAMREPTVGMVETLVRQYGCLPGKPFWADAWNTGIDVALKE